MPSCARWHEVDSKINVQPLWSEPRKIVDEFAVGEDEDISKKTMVSHLALGTRKVHGIEV